MYKSSELLKFFDKKKEKDFKYLLYSKKLNFKKYLKLKNKKIKIKFDKNKTRSIFAYSKNLTITKLILKYFNKKIKKGKFFYNYAPKKFFYKMFSKKKLKKLFRMNLSKKIYNYFLNKQNMHKIVNHFAFLYDKKAFLPSLNLSYLHFDILPARIKRKLSKIIRKKYHKTIFSKFFNFPKN